MMFSASSILSIIVTDTVYYLCECLSTPERRVLYVQNFFDASNSFNLVNGDIVVGVYFMPGGGMTEAIWNFQIQLDVLGLNELDVDSIVSKFLLCFNKFVPGKLVVNKETGAIINCSSVNGSRKQITNGFMECYNSDSDSYEIQEVLEKGYGYLTSIRSFPVKRQDKNYQNAFRAVIEIESSMIDYEYGAPYSVFY